MNKIGRKIERFVHRGILILLLKTFKLRKTFLVVPNITVNFIFKRDYACFFLTGFCFFCFVIYFWLQWVFVAAHGLSLLAASRLLIAVASVVAEHGF